MGPTPPIPPAPTASPALKQCVAVRRGHPGRRHPDHPAPWAILLEPRGEDLGMAVLLPVTPMRVKVTP